MFRSRVDSPFTTVKVCYVFVNQLFSKTSAWLLGLSNGQSFGMFISIAYYAALFYLKRNNY